MNRQRGKTPEFSNSAVVGARLRLLFAVAMILIRGCLPFPTVLAQDSSARPTMSIVIHGTVLDTAHHGASDALVRLAADGGSLILQTKSDAAGAFVFSVSGPARYKLTAESSALRSRAVALTARSQESQTQVELVLEAADKISPGSSAKPPSPGEAMEFADAPKFTVAGVTDWTAAGGHGSDIILRTSETLARDTLALKPDSGTPVPRAVGAGVSEDEGKLRASLAGDIGSFAANHQLGEFYLRAGRYREAIPLLESAYQIDPADYGNEYSLATAYKDAGDLSRTREHLQRLLKHQENAELHRLAGELDEGLGDPLAAVHEFEQAVRMEASEQNYFEWGSELLLHRAVWQAQEVFKKGTEAYPESVRMLTALGTALFAGAKYEDAALRLCRASDLNPAEPEPYIFLGKVELAAPASLPCVEAKLAQFAQTHPENSLANYFYAMTILKRQKKPADALDLRQAEALLNRAVTLDNKCADAYLQLGNLQIAEHNFDKAIALYGRAIEANPNLGDAHYRLGVAYDRSGEHAKAMQEYQRHDEIEKEQAAEVERQRREVKQFTVILEGQPKYPPAQ